MAVRETKPYLKLAGTLVVVGMGLFSLERLGLTRMESGGEPMHIDGTILSLMVLVPLGLVLAGVLVFAYGKIRRL